MVGSVQGSASQPFSVLYQPGNSSQESAKARQNGNQKTSTSSSEEAGETPNIQKAEGSEKNESSGRSTRYAAYDRDSNGMLSSSSGDDQRRGSVVNITV